MNSKALVALGAGTVLALGAVAPLTSASAGSAAGNRGQLCKGNRFLVEHIADTVNGYPVPAGYYKTYTRRLSCHFAVLDLHNWLATGETTENWTVGKGGRGNRSIKFAAPGGKTFFEIKLIKNQ